jgi:hypothetical protein
VNSGTRFDPNPHPGWRSVDVGDGLLVGSAEGGFCGLDEFTPTDGMIQDISTAAASSDSPISEPGRPTAKVHCLLSTK